MSIEKKKIAVLVISCDSYSDLWLPCVKVFDKYWPDCEFDKFLMSNNKEFSYPNFNNIRVGDDKSWSHGLKLCLDKLKVDYDYIFTMLEDYYFIEKVDNKYIKDMFNDFIKINGNFLSLFKLPSKLKKSESIHFGELENNIPYRQSCVFTLWKTETLYNILNEKENAWEFEKVGVVRGFEYDGFYGSYRNYNFINVLIQGKLYPKDYKKLKLIFPEIIINRLMFSWIENFKRRFRDNLVHLFLLYVPSRIKSYIYFNRKFNK
jgi:hypothetical protein